MSREAAANGIGTVERVSVLSIARSAILVQEGAAAEVPATHDHDREQRL